MQTTNGIGMNRVLEPATLLSLVALLLAGCTTAGYRKGDGAALTMQNAAAEVQAESQALELTLSALKGLINDPGADLKQPFRHFSAALARLVACAHDTEKTGSRMARKNAAYLQAWDKELAAMEFEHVRDLSQERRTTVSNGLDKVAKRYENSQTVVQPLISYLTDIRRALSSDLTPAGLEAIKPVVTNADNSALKVQTALAALTTELTDSGARLSSFPVPSAPLAEATRR